MWKRCPGECEASLLYAITSWPIGRTYSDYVSLQPLSFAVPKGGYRQCQQVRIAPNNGPIEIPKFISRDTKNGNSLCHPHPGARRFRSRFSGRGYRSCAAQDRREAIREDSECPLTWVGWPDLNRRPLRPEAVAIQPGWLGVRELRPGTGGSRGDGLVSHLWLAGPACRGGHGSPALMDCGLCLVRRLCPRLTRLGGCRRG